MPTDRTVRRWRNEKRLQEHFEHLAEIAEAISASVNVTKNTPKGNQFDFFEYTIWDNDSGFGVTRDWLGNKLQAKVETVFERTSQLEVTYFVAHLELEKPEIRAEGLEMYARNNPYDLIAILNSLSQNRNFKGKCLKCQHWH